MADIQKFDLGSDYTEQKLVENLTALFLLTKDQPVTEPITFYDTFDWRLYKKSLLLCQTGNVFLLHEMMLCSGRLLAANRSLRKIFQKAHSNPVLNHC